HALGFRTFVLQGGEDPGLTDDWVTGTGAALKEEGPDCAVTLSLGERSEPVYRMWKEAGADRDLLRHETADEEHYRMLHPPELSFQRRRECLYALKELGYQVGAGFMVGSPGQTEETLAKDLEFLQELQPHMIGIGPFVPHRDTPFGGEPAGTAEQTLEWISRLRIAFPKTLLPATTALGTIDPVGREKGILAGANVVMPNLSPADVRSKYELYDNKLCTGAEAAESLADLKARLQGIGYEIEVGRGDHPDCL
ncbi:MAG: [Mogibacterium sp.]|nr:[FeFe] hydrogenase H-cluster radical SAM maturase HydE [Mogibacterium sp.]